MKSIEITPRILSLLSAHLDGDPPSADSITVFEMIALSTRPLKKSGSIYDKAMFARSTLVEMAEFLNSGKQVPLHVMHATYGELPSGRLFNAEVYDEEDASEIRTLFYLNNTEAKLIEGIQTSVIASSSVGVLPVKMLCSECGWDYRGDDATAYHIWDRTCENGHTIGEDGAHLNVLGVEDWMETSLVGRGADQSAKIVSRSKARLKQNNDQIEKLAASGIPLEALALVATQEQQGNDTVSQKELLDRLEEQSAKLATSATTITDLEAKLKAAEDKITALEASANPDDKEAAAALKASEDAAAAELKAANDAKDDAEAKLKEEEEQKTAALEFLQDQTKKALIASGKEDPKAPETVSECISTLKESAENLANLLASNGKSVSADAGSEKGDGNPRSGSLAAFRTRDR